MKNFLQSIVIVLCCVLLSTSLVFAQTITERPDIKMVINGQTVINENVPIIVNERTLIPLRELLVNLGVQNDDEHIIWKGEDKSITIIRNTTKIELKINSNIGNVNGVECNLDSPAILYKDKTYIPARFVGEALDKTIDWDDITNSVLVNDKVDTKESVSFENKGKMVTINYPAKYGKEVSKSSLGTNGDIWNDTHRIAMLVAETTITDYFDVFVNYSYKYMLEDTQKYSQVKITDEKTIVGTDGRKITYKKLNYTNAGILDTYVKEDVYAITDIGDGFAYQVQISATSATISEDMIKEFMNIIVSEK